MINNKNNFNSLTNLNTNINLDESMINNINNMNITCNNNNNNIIRLNK
jgi:hypothetical protein